MRGRNNVTEPCGEPDIVAASLGAEFTGVAPHYNVLAEVMVEFREIQVGTPAANPEDSLSDWNVFDGAGVWIYDHFGRKPIDVLVDAVRVGIADIHNCSLSDLVRCGLDQLSNFRRGEVEVAGLNHLFRGLIFLDWNIALGAVGHRHAANLLIGDVNRDGMISPFMELMFAVGIDLTS